MDTTITTRSSDLPWPHNIHSNSTQASIIPYPMDNRIHLSYDPHPHHDGSDRWHDNHHDHDRDPEAEAETDDGSHLLRNYPSGHRRGFDGAHRSGLLHYQSHPQHVDVAVDDDDEDEEDFVDPHVDAYAAYHNNLGFIQEDEDDIGYGDDQIGGGSSYNTHGYSNNNVNWVDSSTSQNIPDQIPLPAPTPPRRGVKRPSESISADSYNVNNAGMLFDPSSFSPQLAGSPTSLMQASGGGGPGSTNSSSKLGKGSGTGSLFFKTKLCIKFRAGTCPYNSNCNFAHGMEELRKPPPGWEDMVAAQEAAATVAAAGSGVEASTAAGSAGGRNNSSIKENASGQLVLSGSESLRFRRTRRCKKFYSEEGCPYGERCNFLHDDQVKSRESNAISLGPGSGSGGGGGVSTNTTTSILVGANGGGNGGGGSGSGERPSNWKTRMCNKWEMTGHCPFGQKCNFAHGAKELQMYSGAQIDFDTTTIVSNGLLSDNKQITRITNPKLDHGSSSYVSTPSYMVDAHTTSRHKNTYLPTSKIEKPTKLLENWKGPSNQISRIYGDWLDDDE